MLQVFARVLLFLLVLTFVPDFAIAGPTWQASDGEAYTVQAGDWLSKIAEKYYGASVNYPRIIEATNAKAVEDRSFASISDANLIVPGQRLWIPPAIDADTIALDGLLFAPVEIEDLGIRTLVPRTWPAVDENDPLLKHSWSAGIFSLVSFTTMPGNDVLSGLARLLAVNREDLTGGALGGELSEARFGERAWTFFTRNEGGITSVVGATVQDKVIYQIRLFAETSQKDSILRAILDNFEISDPSHVQQSISIDTPMPGASLTSPFELRGTSRQYPFKGRLIYRVLDAAGNQVGRSPFEVVGQIGDSATFAIPAAYGVDADGPGTVEVAEFSEADGTIITIDSIGVTLLADPAGYDVTIDEPFAGANVSSPVRIRGKTGDRPFEGRLNYRIVDAAGQELSSGLLASAGEPGQINFYDGFAEIEVASAGPGRVEVFDIRPADGKTYTIGTVNVWLVPEP
jgi:hypothetical protein